MQLIKHILFIFLGAWILVPKASAAGNWQHYVGLSLAGGEANTLPLKASASVKPLLGGEGQAMFLYEAQGSRMFVQIGAGADYSLTQLRMSDLIESREATDITKEAHLYQYRYTSITERQRMFAPQVMAQLGFLPVENLYLALGVKVTLPLISDYASSARMATTGSYERWEADYIENRPQYGFYPETEYGYSDKFSPVKTYISPTLEIGGNWNLRRTTLRAGLFADYGFRIGDKLSEPVTDYSKVDISPSSQTQQNLSDNIRINSILNSEYISDFSHLTIGIRFTVLFNVTTFKVPCHCVP